MFKAILVLTLFTSLLMGADAEKLQKVSLQLHWKYQFEFAGFIAAKEKGFYKDVGLDVELREYKNGMDIEEEVLSGRATYGIYNSTILMDYLKGKPIVLLASYFKRAALVIMAQPSIHSPKDLRGKKVMAATKQDFELNFGEYFRGYGMSVDDVDLVPHSYSMQEFIDGKVAAMTAFISFQPAILKEKGIKYTILDPSDENLFILQLELFTSKKEEQNFPQRDAAFVAATQKGWEYAFSHKKEMAELIHTKYNPTLSVKELLREAEGVEHLILPYTYEIGSIDTNFLKKQKKLFQNRYNLHAQRNLRDFIWQPKKQQKELKLTEKEEAYINENPSVAVCVNFEFFPIDGIEDEKITGEMGDIYKLISEMTSLRFTPVASESEENLRENLRYKKCKLLSVMATESRTFTMLRPTHAFSETTFALVSRLESSFVDKPTYLKGKVILVQKESFRDYLNYLYPYLSIKVEPNQNKMVQDVLYGRAYGIVTLDEQADYIIDKYGYGKLKINGFLAKERPIKGSIGVQKDEKTLFDILDKALAHISKEQIEIIRNSWRISRYHTTRDYSLAFKILFFMGIVLLIMFYYQRKLKNFNKELERQVSLKTKELREINESLEATVKEKLSELVQKDKLLTTQSKQAVMGEMISMIAHQWRQPLNTITLQISNLQLKEMMGEKITQKELSETLHNISDAIVYLSDTIDDFKTYFHPDKELTKLKVEDLLEKVRTFIQARANESGVVLEIQGDLQREINIYVNELIQVLLNILNNAIDAYEKEQTQEKKITITVLFAGETMKISIKDRAGGIKKEHLERLFEPYFSTKGKNGTGLGLYMSQMIIQKHFNGTIEVHSEGKETEFVVVIPRALCV